MAVPISLFICIWYSDSIQFGWRTWIPQLVDLAGYCTIRVVRCTTPTRACFIGWWFSLFVCCFDLYFSNVISLLGCDVFITLLPQSYPMYPSISFCPMYHHNICLSHLLWSVAFQISPLILRIGSFGFGFTYLNSYGLTSSVYTYQTVHCSPALPSSFLHRHFSSIKATQSRFSPLHSKFMPFRICILWYHLWQTKKGVDTQPFAQSHLNFMITIRSSSVRFLDTRD